MVSEQGLGGQDACQLRLHAVHGVGELLVLPLHVVKTYHGSVRRLRCLPEKSPEGVLLLGVFTVVIAR